MKKLIVMLLLIGFSPISTAALITDGLIIHLDADTIARADGDRVITWANSSDASLSSLTVTNGTAVQRPRMVHNAVNGHKAVDFTWDDDNGDGIIDSLDKRNMLNSGATTWNWNASLGVTMIIVGQGGDFRTSGANNQRAVQVGPQGAVGAVNNGQVLSADLAASAGTLTDEGSGIRYNNGASLTGPGEANPVIQDQWHISFRQMAQGASYDQAFYSVGNLTNIVASVANPANTVNFVDANNKLILGAAYRSDGTVNEYYQGQIAEILVYNGQLTQAQMAEIGNYLSDKYAIAFVPEPATLVLLGLGSLVAIRCRKA